MTIKKTREILGSEAKGQTDMQIQEIITTASLFADIAIEQLLSKRQNVNLAGSNLTIK